MKLRRIAEGFMLQKMREALIGVEAPIGVGSVSDKLYEPESGHDSGSQEAGGTPSLTGVPTNPRHRIYFGMETTPSNVTL